ncbi:hypothetical protein XENOCAPTIV_023234, partial [Xenoophorus captivus]
SPSPPDADPTKDGDVTLHCSLVRSTSLGPCPENSLLWVDETGTGLTGEGVGYKFRQTGCDSYLTVKLQSSSNRRYSCQFVEGNTVKIEAHYPFVLDVILLGQTLNKSVLLHLYYVCLLKSFNIFSCFSMHNAFLTLDVL